MIMLKLERHIKASKTAYIDEYTIPENVEFQTFDLLLITT